MVLYKFVHAISNISDDVARHDSKQYRQLDMTTLSIDTIQSQITLSIDTIWSWTIPLNWHATTPNNTIDRYDMIFNNTVELTRHDMTRSWMQ